MCPRVARDESKWRREARTERRERRREGFRKNMDGKSDSAECGFEEGRPDENSQEAQETDCMNLKALVCASSATKDKRRPPDMTRTPKRGKSRKKRAGKMMQPQERRGEAGKIEVVEEVEETEEEEGKSLIRKGNVHVSSWKDGGGGEES